MVSCDVITNFPLQQLADAFRVEDAALSCLLAPFAKQWAEVMDVERGEGGGRRRVMGADYTILLPPRSLRQAVG